MFFGKKFSGYHKGALSGLDILVLSIIKNNDGISGYNLIQKINRKFEDLWKASAGTIYPLLNRLSEKQFVSIEEITDNNRLKKIYRVTEKGKKALQQTLDHNLQPSINTLGDYIRTVISAIPIKANIEANMEDTFCCFPFGHGPHGENIDTKDFSITNIKKIEVVISRLNSFKAKLVNRIDHLDKRIKKYQDLIDKINKHREKHAKPIDIAEDEDV